MLMSSSVLLSYLTWSFTSDTMFVCNKWSGDMDCVYHMNCIENLHQRHRQNGTSCFQLGHTIFMQTLGGASTIEQSYNRCLGHIYT